MKKKTKICLRCKKREVKGSSKFCGTDCNVIFDRNLRKERNQFLSDAKKIERIFFRVYGRKMK